MSELDDVQQEVVNTPGSVIVTACPGSGKTRILTYRVFRAIQDLRSTKHRIVALTFTNRAAEEIKSRVDRFEVDLSQLWTGTIHAFALE